LKNADPNTEEYEVYSKLPEIAIKYAFECSNGCPNIYTQKGCEGAVESKIYVINSIVPKEKMDAQLHAAIEKDSSISSFIGNDGATTITWVASNDIIGTEGSVLTLLDKKGHFFKH
jgi:hypothetical protein